MSKIKTYVLTVSRTFPAYHPRRGEETNFVDLINYAIHQNRSGVEQDGSHILPSKLHTIRTNFPLWQKRIEEVQAGKAVLSLRYWEGVPRKSKQVEFARLTSEDGVGVQKLAFKDRFLVHPIVNKSTQDAIILANNDGLSYEDYCAWFHIGKYNLSEPFAIIHFTSFRYD